MRNTTEHIGCYLEVTVHNFLAVQVIKSLYYTSTVETCRSVVKAAPGAKKQLSDLSFRAGTQR